MLRYLKGPGHRKRTAEFAVSWENLEEPLWLNTDIYIGIQTVIDTDIDTSLSLYTQIREASHHPSVIKGSANVDRGSYKVFHYRYQLLPIIFLIINQYYIAVICSWYIRFTVAYYPP